MRKLILSGAAALAALGAAGPAFAQEQHAAGGAYAGVVLGYDEVALDDGVDSGSTGDLMYGLSAGYDFAVGGNAIMGLEVEAAESGVGISATDILVTGDRFTVSGGRDLYIGARIGTHLGKTLVYLKGGYTNVRMNAEYTDGVSVLEEGESLDGFRVGGGVEVNMGPVAVRGEYRYSQYGELLNSGVDLSRHQLVAVAVGKF